MIVSDVAGTTRDAIDTPIEVDGRKLLLVDTAGIRRAAKVNESVEYYTSLRSQRAAERADVALVVCDATDGVTSQDLRIAEHGDEGRAARPRSCSTSGTSPAATTSTSTTSARGSTASCACARRC